MPPGPLAERKRGNVAHAAQSSPTISPAAHDADDPVQRRLVLLRHAFIGGYATEIGPRHVRDTTDQTLRPCDWEKWRVLEDRYGKCKGDCVCTSWEVCYWVKDRAVAFDGAVGPIVCYRPSKGGAAAAAAAAAAQHWAGPAAPAAVACDAPASAAPTAAAASAAESDSSRGPDGPPVHARGFGPMQ